jgi:hypothetical protein
MYLSKKGLISVKKRKEGIGAFYPFCCSLVKISTKFLPQRTTKREYQHNPSTRG